MPTDRDQLAVLEQALAESPDNLTLRLHVAELHLGVEPPDAGHARAALGHAQVVLAAQPDHLGALTVGARAADAAGEPTLALSYRRLVDALGGTASPPSGAPPAAPAPAAPPPAAPPPAAPPPAAPPPAAAPSSPPPPPDRAGVAPDAPEATAVHRPDGSHDDLDGESGFYLRVTEQADGTEQLTPVEVPGVRLDDVGGLDDVKRKLRSTFLAPMDNAELREMYGKSLRGGLLLYGPPGCGKTFLARALAGELKASFFAVGLHEILDMWLGESEKNLHALFDEARRNAPCLLFLDEVDALGHKRSNLRATGGMHNVVVQLLTELDGVQELNEGLFVVAATNQPWDVDPALRRPGRFDRTMLVLPPDRPARAAILAYHLRSRPVAADVDLEALAAATELYSGADLRLVCETAAERALEDSLESGTPRPIDRGDLERARHEVQPSTRAWFNVAKNFAQFANEGGRYDDLLAYMRQHRL